MEKHDWNVQLGYQMINRYSAIKSISDEEWEVLKIMLMYPEKYWKQINFYYNANKAWIPARQEEKIHNLERQQEQRMKFIETLRRGDWL